MHRHPLTAIVFLSGACTARVPHLETPRKPSPPPSAEGEVLVIRTADPVSVRPAGEIAAVPLAYFDKEARLPAGSWVVVGPGGRAEGTFPDGSTFTASGTAAIEIVDPTGKTGPIFRAVSLDILHAKIAGGSRAELPGGASARGEGAGFAARLVGGRIVRVEARGSVPLTVTLADAEVELDAAKFVDFPARGVARPDGGE